MVKTLITFKEEEWDRIRWCTEMVLGMLILLLGLSTNYMGLLFVILQRVTHLLQFMYFL